MTKRHVIKTCGGVGSKAPLIPNLAIYGGMWSASRFCVVSTRKRPWGRVGGPLTEEVEVIAFVSLSPVSADLLRYSSILKMEYIFLRNPQAVSGLHAGITLLFCSLFRRSRVRIPAGIPATSRYFVKA